MTLHKSGNLGELNHNHLTTFGRKVMKRHLKIIDPFGSIISKIKLFVLLGVIAFNYNKQERESLKNFINFEETLKNDLDEVFERFEFNHPIYILFSSGTTGKPKCITHGSGNVLIEHNKEFMLHCDIRENEKLFYYTTTGWMMWNWLVGGLATGSSIFLFDGAPVYPKIDVLLEYCQNKKINLFGAVSYTHLTLPTNSRV